MDSAWINIIKDQGFEHFSATALSKPLTIDFYKTWIENQHHGEMEYLDRHTEYKLEPKKLMPKARSAIIITQDYFPHPKPQDSPLKDSRVALYAQGADYHHWFKDQLDSLCQQLSQAYPEEEFLCFTDSAPVLERELAYKSGLGWHGKNTCLINSQKGSLFFIGEIFTSLELNPLYELHPDRCGTCTRCIDACPTEALSLDKNLDARKCISYLTIESKKVPKLELRTQMNDWLFGCDICQTVCPWNEKKFGESIREQQHSMNAPTEDLLSDLQWIMESSNKTLQKTFKDSPLSRARGNGLKRNAIIVATNQKIKKLIPQIEELKKNAKLSELCEWSLGLLYKS